MASSNSNIYLQVVFPWVFLNADFQKSEALYF